MQHQDLNDEEKKQVASTLDLAEQALVYARSFVTVKGSHPDVHKDEEAAIDAKIQIARETKLPIHEVLTYFLFLPHDKYETHFQEIKVSNKQTKEHKVANCMELSFLIANFLRKIASSEAGIKANIKRIDVCNTGKDHTIVAINMGDEKSDRAFFAKTCVLIDGLLDTCTRGRNVYDVIKNYKYEP